MAYFLEMAQTNGTAAVTVSANMPDHAIDDYLIAYVTLDTGTITLPAGWAALTGAPANPVSSGIVTYLAFKKAVSTAETFSVTTGDAYTIGIYCFRDVDTTTPFDGVTPANAASATGFTATSTSVTTQTANALVVYLVAQETPSTTPSTVLVNPGVMWIDGFDSTGVTATTSAHQAAAWYINRAAGAAPTPTFQSNVTSTFVKATFALRNKAGGRVPAYIDDVTAPALVLTHAHHVGTTDIGGVTFPAALTTTAAINGKTVTVSTATLGADFGINPYASGAGRTAAITAATALRGFEVNFTATKNLSTGLLMGSLIALNPKSGTFGLGSISQGGLVARIGSSATAWEAHQIAAKDTSVTTENRYIFAIAPGDLTTDYGTPGTAVTTTAVKYVQFLMNCPAFAANVYLSELHQVYAQVVAGGDASFPVDTDGLVAVGKSFILPVFQKSGAAGLIAYAPIQVGGGDAVNFQIDSGVIQFPRIYSPANNEIAYHAPANRIGIGYNGKSGDVIKHTNSLISAPSAYYWQIAAAATSAATWDFSGTTVVGANVTLRNVTTFDALTFSGCPTIDASGVTLTNSTIKGVAAGNNSLTVTSATAISSCSINAAGVTAGNYLTTASPAVFANCQFTGGGGHAIRINSATGSPFAFIGNTFTGFGAIASTGAALLIDAVAVVINVTGGTTPTYRLINGGTVTINNTVTLTLTGLVDGSDIVILEAGTVTERVNVDTNLGTTYPYSFGTGGSVDICIYKAGYIPYTVRGYTLPASSQSFPVTQVVDRNYLP